jgi:hypothetical protein
MLDMRGEHIEIVEDLVPLVINHLEYLLGNAGRQTVWAPPITQMLDDLLGLDGMLAVPANGNVEVFASSKILVGNGAVGHGRIANVEIYMLCGGVYTGNVRKLERCKKVPCCEKIRLNDGIHPLKATPERSPRLIDP